MKLLRDYVAPIQRLVFEGYSFHGNALLSFVVKYHEEGQRELRPHHDHSTFTTNTALNRQGIDYQVGFRLVTFCPCHGLTLISNTGNTVYGLGVPQLYVITRCYRMKPNKVPVM